MKGCNVSSDIRYLTENEDFEQGSNEKASRTKTSWDDQIFRDAMQARTCTEIVIVVLDANPLS